MVRILIAITADLLGHNLSFDGEQLLKTLSVSGDLFIASMHLLFVRTTTEVNHSKASPLFVSIDICQISDMLLALCLLTISFSSVSPVSRLYGPGLRASFQVPVRYFYLQTYNTQGQR